MELMPDYATRVVRFGVFEVDLRAGELRRNDRKVKIQNQPFQILGLLLERPGEVITREEMRARLWPAETFVDFDHGLNSAVRRLRDTLGDSAETPKYVETLGRRGYRFIFPVEQNGRGSGDMADASPRVATMVVPIPAAPQRGDADTAAKKKKRRIAVALAAVVVSCAAGLAYFRVRSSEVPTVANYVQLTHDGRQKWLVGTDGARLYLGLGFYGSEKIGEISVVGGEPRMIPMPPSTNMIPLDLSRDGAQILTVDGQGAPFHGGFWSMHLPAGGPHRMGDAEGSTGSWSPDGKALAYSDGSDIFLAKADGSEPRKLPMMKPLTRINFIAWSTDGEHLRFHASAHPTQPLILWEVSTRGGEPRSLIPSWSNVSDSECCGKWTADGRHFVFQSRGQIWALPRKGGFLHSSPQPIQLTSSPMSLTTPLPSKDGKKLFVIGETHRGELTRYDPKLGQFSPFLGGIPAEFIDFSKDGQWVAYVSYPSGFLWRSRVDGSERLQLTSSANYVLMPRWSPDGKHVIFYEMEMGKTARIYEVSSEGGSLRPLMPDDSSQQADASWSPDGSKIIFGGAGGDSTSTIRVLDLTTRQVSTLAGSQGFFSPRWSPDGRYVAALTADTSSLHLFNFQSEKWTELARGTTGGFPSWSKDGQYIYVFGDNITGVIRVRISDRRVERVADLKTFASTGRYDRSLALAPDDSLLLLRDTGTQDVYALDWKEP
jgi:Tol biopolymer transport system component/DNA-binding winged helix-turn-helix (wHTH) protein